jgi:hypothetical protein
MLGLASAYVEPPVVPERIRMARGKRDGSSDAPCGNKRVKEQLRYGDPSTTTSRGGDDDPIGGVGGTASRKSVVRFSNAPGMIIWVPSASKSSNSMDDPASSSHHTIGKHSSWYKVNGFQTVIGPHHLTRRVLPLLDSNKTINAL